MSKDSTLMAVVDDVLREMVRQTEVHGLEENKFKQFPTYIAEEFGEVAQAFQVEIYGEGKPTDKSNLDEELIQLTAMCMKTLLVYRGLKYAKENG